MANTWTEAPVSDLPREMQPRKLPHGWTLVPLADLPLARSRPRVALVAPEEDRAAIVWRSCWRAAMRQILKTGNVSTFYRAPVMGWRPNEQAP